MMVEDGNLEILKLLSSTSAEISQGEVLLLEKSKVYPCSLHRDHK